MLCVWDTFNFIHFFLFKGLWSLKIRTIFLDKQTRKRFLETCIQFAWKKKKTKMEGQTKKQLQRSWIYENSHWTNTAKFHRQFYFIFNTCQHCIELKLFVKDESTIALNRSINLNTMLHSTLDGSSKVYSWST